MYRFIEYLMKKSRFALFMLLALTGALVLCAVLRPGPNNDKRRVTMQLMMTGLQAEHYKPLPVNDSLSDRVFKLYIKRLDYYKQYFTQEDIDKFKAYEFKIDDEIQAGSFELFDLVNDVLNKRVAEDSEAVKKILASPLDFDKKEEIETDYEKMPFAKDDKALAEQRRKSLKYQVLYRLSEAMTSQEKAQENKDTTVKVKPFDQMEKDARTKVLNTYKTLFHDFAEATEQDKLSEFIDCIANAFDPHTEFFAPPERKAFDIRMSGQLEGIGAQLLDKNGDITVTKVIAGSPAWKNGELKEGDQILKVKQDTGEAVDIQGMRLDKAVELIRGKKGTKVTLTIKKANKSVKNITLVRDVIQIAETFAHDALIDQGKKIGYIRLPEFYTKFDEEGSRFCWSDVRDQLIQLRGMGAQGVVLDLRDNGGGSLQDVVKMVGLFIKSGPVVQIKNRAQQANIMSDNDTNVYFNGPLVVLVDGYSASASEIFAAAIQDYKRGIIMGSTTYGKGTVQQVFDLDDYVSASFKDLKPLGSVKITISKFYRINGGTTQRDGVTPDIVMPDAYNDLYVKEKNSDFPIPWDKISPASYTIWNNPPDYDYLRKQSEQRLTSDSALMLVSQEQVQFKKEHDHTVYSLNLKEYRKQQKEQQDINKKFEGITKVNPEMTIVPNPDEALKMKSDTLEAKSENNWMKQLTKDAELYEATRVIDDMK
jgi:carboxyl-terminal processing protease